MGKGSEMPGRVSASVGGREAARMRAQVSEARRRKAAPQRTDPVGAGGAMRMCLCAVRSAVWSALTEALTPAQGLGGSRG